MLSNKMTACIQWNIRSLQANREELQLLLSTFIPDIVCLQETQLKANSDTGFKNYSPYHCPKNSESNDVFHGGVAILIKNTLAHKNVKLSTSLQAVAVRVSKQSRSAHFIFLRHSNGIKQIL